MTRTKVIPIWLKVPRRWAVRKALGAWWVLLGGNPYYGDGCRPFLRLQAPRELRDAFSLEMFIFFLFFPPAMQGFRWGSACGQLQVSSSLDFAEHQAHTSNHLLAISRLHWDSKLQSKWFQNQGSLSQCPCPSLPTAHSLSPKCSGVGPYHNCHLPCEPLLQMHQMGPSRSSSDPQAGL